MIEIMGDDHRTRSLINEREIAFADRVGLNVEIHWRHGHGYKVLECPNQDAVDRVMELIVRTMKNSGL